MTHVFITCATLLGALAIYLCSPNQRWLRLPLSAKWRVIAWALLVAAFALWIRHTDMRTGVFIAAILLMLACGLLPFLSLLKTPSPNGREEKI